LERKVALQQTELLTTAEEMHELKSARDSAERKARDLEASLSALRADTHGKKLEGDWDAQEKERQLQTLTQSAATSRTQLLAHSQELEEEVLRERGEAQRLRMSLQHAEETVALLRHAEVEEATSKARNNVGVQGLADAAEKAEKRIIELDAMTRALHVRLDKAETSAQNACAQLLAVQSDLLVAHEERDEALDGAVHAEEAARDSENARVRAVAASTASRNHEMEDLKRHLNEVEVGAEDVRQRNGVLSQLLRDAQSRLEDADVLISSLQQQAADLRVDNDNRDYELQHSSQLEHQLQQQVLLLETKCAQLAVDVKDTACARELAVASCNEASRTGAASEHQLQLLQQELEMARVRHGKEERRAEDLQRAVDASATQQTCAVAEVQRLQESVHREQAGKADLTEALHKEILKREENEATVLSMVANARVSDARRREEVQEDDERRQQVVTQMQQEQQRAVRADANVHALLAQVQTLDGRETYKKSHKRDLHARKETYKNELHM